MPIERCKFVEIDRPDDVDDRQLSIVRVKHCHTADFLALQQQVHFEVPVLLAGHTDKTRPPRTTELRADRFDVSRRVFTVVGKLETLDVDPFDTVDQFLDSLFIGSSFDRNLALIRMSRSSIFTSIVWLAFATRWSRLLIWILES